MGNLKNTFVGIKISIILFFLFAGIIVSYSQDKSTPKQDKKQITEKGTIIYVDNEKQVVKSLKKSKDKSYTTSKKTSDVLPPVITCPSNKQLACGSLVPNYLNELIVTDDSGGDIYLTQSTGGTKFYDGMIIVFTATDESGNSSSCSITITALTPDVTPPSFNCPTNVTLNCGDVLPNYATDPIMNLQDDCSISVSWEMTPAPGTPFYNGIPVQIKYTDPSGNTSFCNFNITQANTDIIPPTLSCPGNQIQSCGSLLSDYRTMVTGFDNCLGNLTVSQSPLPGTPFIPGMTVVLNVKDVSNNTSTCSFIVNASPDTVSPVLSCLGTQTLSCGSVLPDYASMVSVTDNCDSSSTIIQSPSAGSAFTPGMTVTLTAKDASNNVSICSFIVNISIDVTSPVITNCPASQILAIGDIIPDYTGLITVTDNCDNNPVITQIPAAGTSFSSGTNVTLIAKDVSGNTQSCSFNIKASGGDLPPVLSCPSGMELYANSTLPNYVSYLTNLSDDITDNFDLIFTQNPPQGTIFTEDTNVTITAKDASGNINSCTFLVKLKTIVEEINCNTGIFNVSNLNGINGFTVFGDSKTRESGFSVNTAGDVNNDGIDDFIIGAPGNYNPWYGKDKVYKIIHGAAFVVFGKTTGFPPNIDLGLLDGTNGFAIRNDTPSNNFPETGYGVSSAGDLNGDGIDDFMISDPTRESSYGYELGHVYVIFGKNGGFPANFNLSALNGTNGFTLIGNDSYGNLGEAITSVGDLNGDGFQDIAVITRGSGAGNGKCIIIYGKNGGFPAVLRGNDINGSNGFVITGDALIGKIGKKVSGLGDINGDKIPDIGIGTSYYDQTKLFVIFGRSDNFPAEFNISQINGTNGFMVENSVAPVNYYAGINKAGDVNGDGLYDIFVSAEYILFGKTSFAKTIDLKDLDGSNGFKVSNYFGFEFGYAGDFNGDGIDDCFFDDGILYGRNTWNSTVNLNSITNNEFLRLTIPNAYIYKTAINFAGDINKDGISDLIIGSSPDSYGDNLKVNRNPGYTYVIFGKKIVDIEKPIIANCPANKILEIGNLIPDYTNSITVTDNCDSFPKITQTPVAGSVYDGTNIEVVLLATDASGNSSECKFAITSVADTDPPKIACITDQVIACGTKLIPNYLNLITVTDAGDASPVLTQTPIAGTVFTDGMTITIIAKDASNNESYCSFKVNTSSDEIKPVITCIGDQTLSCGSIVPDYTPLVTATDNCDSSPIITQNPAAGSVFTDGMIITITVKDASNNESYCSFKINASADVTKPVITCIGDQNLSYGVTLPDYRSMIKATDNCDTNLIITQTPSFGTAVTDGMIITMTTADNSGNAASCSFKIHVAQDTEAPTFDCLPDQMFDCGITLVPDFTKMISAADNTDPNPLIAQAPSAGSPYSDGMTITIKVSDKSNNTKECYFKLFTYPVLVDAGEDVEINEGEFVKLFALALENGTYLWTPSTGLSNDKVGNPIAAPKETTTYKVVFKNQDGCEAEDYVTITVLPVQKDETKYGFSPNGDGINDFWEIDNITNYPKNEVLIYNRWGDLVFQTENYNNSTNVFNGIANKSRSLGANQLPEGTYFFEIRVNQPHHFKKTKGYLVLKR
ncbi:HYR domain-containing protein [Flavobacterium defluvii]|uniref:Gliding motility-associated C-terminal domain-containing protein n=1 Tax=Flavobacterium defluvii TaxID=370979 RepID=A0A1M5WRQ3_9FLAO|nr:HYR domain-containing protein [Flavobacterium defluvii]SHH89784.1 gliding motility-associated C-terminal domain-containing protein [Flavobacterium defluvii]